MNTLNKRVEPGAPFRPSATAWNRFLDMVDWVEALRKDLSAGTPGGPVRPSTTVVACNGSGAFVDAGGILSITGAQAEFPQELREAARRPVVTGGVPTLTTNAVAILLDPLASGDFGRAVIDGVATCAVNIVSETHLYARPTIGSTTTLTSDHAGTIRILAKESAGTGAKSCMVLLQHRGGEIGRWIRVTSETADANGNYPAFLRDGDGVGGRSDGEAIYYKVQSGAGTDGVVADGRYWGTLAGTATLAGVTKPLYDGVGMNDFIIPICRDGNNQCDRLRMLHPGQWIENVDCETGEAL